MEVVEVLEKKRKLAKEIAGLLQKFVSETGVPVSSVDVSSDTLYTCFVHPAERAEPLTQVFAVKVVCEL